MIRLLFIGDIVGRPGRELVRRGVQALVAHHDVDLVIANVENAAAGFGVTPEIADEFLRDGIHVMTGGNHIWDKKEIVPYFSRGAEADPPGELPGGRSGTRRLLSRAREGMPVAVINLMGRVFMTAIDDPFRVAETEIHAVRQEARVIFVDFHAEATSEKIAMGWHLDGRATAVVGTHTHVQTADERVLPRGTRHHGCRHDRPPRFGDWRRAVCDPRAVPDGTAAAVRDRHGESSPERRCRGRRRVDGPGGGHRAAHVLGSGD